jgi:hypothetical protein
MAKSVVNSKYSILSNKPVTKDFSGAYYDISYSLPAWFTSWNGEKIIKVYGCSFAYMESENKDPKPSTRYANQFISVHSNITRDDTEHLSSFYLPGETPASQTEREVEENYMMVVNNYYTPKIYDLTNSTAKEITIWFKDSHGETIPLRASYSSEGGFLDEIYQAVFKIECELAILTSPL